MPQLNEYCIKICYCILSLNYCFVSDTEFKTKCTSLSHIAAPLLCVCIIMVMTLQTLTKCMFKSLLQYISMLQPIRHCILRSTKYNFYTHSIHQQVKRLILLLKSPQTCFENCFHEHVLLFLTDHPGHMLTLMCIMLLITNRQFVKNAHSCPGSQSLNRNTPCKQIYINKKLYYVKLVDFHMDAIGKIAAVWKWILQFGNQNFTYIIKSRIMHLQ